MRFVPHHVAVLAAITIALAAATPVSAAPEEVHFVGWGGPEEKQIVGQALAAFERANPGVKVRYTQIPGLGYDYYNKLRLMIVAGMAPDVYYVPDGNFGELASRGVLLNLDPYIAKSKAIKLADMWPSGVDRYRWDGTQLQKGPVYCLPKDIGPHAMYYNKDVFKARGIPFPSAKEPLTWDAATAMWKRLSFKDKNLAHYGISGFPHESAIWSNGGQITSADKRRWVLGSDPSGIAAVQWTADLSLVHKVAPDAAKTAGGSGSASPSQLFESGLAACHFDGRWMVPRFREAAAFDWDVAPIPVPKKGMKSVCWSGSVGFAVHAQTKRPDAGFRLVEFLAGPAGQTLLTGTGFQVPNQRWLAKTDAYMQKGRKPAHAEVFLDAALTSRPGPWTDTPNVFWHDMYWNFIGKVFRGERKAADLLPEIAPLINNALVEGNTVRR